MMNFQYYAPTQVVFGKDTETQVGELIKAQNGTKVLVHYGTGSVIRTGLLESEVGVMITNPSPGAFSPS